MKLTTKCPKCSTVFDVSLETLQQRKGYTRCVNCAHIFDGFEEVQPEGSAPSKPQQITQTIQPQSPPATQIPVATANDDNSNINIPPALQVQQNQPSSDFIIRTRPAATSKTPLDPNHKISDLAQIQPDEFDKKFVISDAQASTTYTKHSIGDIQVDELNDLKIIDETVSIDTTPEDYDDEYVGLTSRVVTGLWVVLIAISVAILLLQAVYVFRVQIAENMPQTRPRLQALCDKIGCDMPWARKPEHILIIHSSLQSQANVNKDEQNQDNEDTNNQVTPEQTSQYILQVVLRNTYGQPQQWPSLILELTDAAGAKIARKNITAQQYLTADYINGPFQASSEYQVQLPIKLQGLKVNGYQVTTFFP